MIAGFVGSAFSGKEIPPFEKVFPDEDKAETHLDPEIIRLREQFRDFAAGVNKRNREAN